MLAVGLGSLGCAENNSEEGTAHVLLRPLFYSFVHEPSGLRALQGSTVCFAVDEGDPTNPCYEATFAGGPLENGDCVGLYQLGAIQIDFSPRANCERAPDRFRIEVVPVAGLRGGLEWYVERLAEFHLDRLSSRPADLIPAVSEPLRLVPDVVVGFPIILVDAMGHQVAWDLSQGHVLETKNGGTVRELQPVDDEGSTWPVRVAAGERSTLSLEIGGEVLPVAEVIATSVEQAASLEIVAGYAGETGGVSEPVGARAIVRDAEGKVIVGTPVEWSLVEGELAIEPLDPMLPSEYKSISDVCVPPPIAVESRRAVLRARLGELSDELELEWMTEPWEEGSDSFAPYPACQRGSGLAGEDGLGCNCASAPGGGRGNWAWLTVLLLALRHRRR